MFARAPDGSSPDVGFVSPGQTGGPDACVFNLADPDRFRIELYAHDWRHDVEKPRPAPLTK
jgi:hypothetical protein